MTRLSVTTHHAILILEIVPRRSGILWVEPELSRANSLRLLAESAEVSIPDIAHPTSTHCFRDQEPSGKRGLAKW